MCISLIVFSSGFEFQENGINSNIEVNEKKTYNRSECSHRNQTNSTLCRGNSRNLRIIVAAYVLLQTNKTRSIFEMCYFLLNMMLFEVLNLKQLSHSLKKDPTTASIIDGTNLCRLTSDVRMSICTSALQQIIKS